MFHRSLILCTVLLCGAVRADGPLNDVAEDSEPSLQPVRVPEYQHAPPTYYPPQYGSQRGSYGGYQRGGRPRPIGLLRGRRYLNGRYFGNFNNRFYGPQYGYF